MPVFMAMTVVLLIIILLLGDPTRKLWAATEIFTGPIYFVIYMLLYTRLVRGVFSWLMPPDVALIRELLVAYTLASFGKPGEWRGLAYRRRIAVHLGNAASILEGPMRRVLTSPDRPRQSPKEI